VWFTGTVQDAYGRPTVAGTQVSAQANGAPCQGAGKTEDLYWVPQAPNAQPVGIRGFYFIPVEMAAGCADKLLIFRITVAGSPNVQMMSVSTPPYGNVVQVQVQILPSTQN